MGAARPARSSRIERKSGQRIVDENDQFVALMRFAAKHPFELWVVPKRQLSGPPDIAELLVRDYFVACTMR
jgi:galactose-1-phosphate uridylyltransferase